MDLRRRGLLRRVLVRDDLLGNEEVLQEINGVREVGGTRRNPAKGRPPPEAGRRQCRSRQPLQA